MTKKEATRKYMEERRKSAEPPPSPEEIRRQLGFYLKEDHRERLS